MIVAVVDHLVERFAGRSAFFVESVELPDGLPSVECGLHGPAMGDSPVPDAECVLEVRGGRAGPSRLCRRPPRPCRIVTVVAGPDGGEPCVLYTAFGGPPAPREPWDSSLSERNRSLRHLAATILCPETRSPSRASRARQPAVLPIVLRSPEKSPRRSASRVSLANAGIDG